MARYTIQGFDCSAEGMERLRMQSEFILLAYANGDSSPADIVAEWESDVDSCDRGESFDFEAVRAAIREWAASNSGAIERELSGFRSLADSGGLNWNDESAAEFDSAPLRLYVADAWHGEPDAYRHGRLVALKSGAVALVLLDSPHSAWADSEACELALAAGDSAVWDSLAYPIGERERSAAPGVYPLALPPIGEPVADAHTPWELVANTTRACYWHKPGCGYLALPSDRHAPAPDYSAGYKRLDSLMKLKGESGATIARLCDASGEIRAGLALADRESS